MKKEFTVPSMHISRFLSENIITTSGFSGTTKDNYDNADKQLTLDFKSFFGSEN